MACGKFCSRCANSRSVASAGCREIFAAGDGGQLQQRERGDGIAGRLRAVVIVLHAQNQILRVGGALPETAVLRVVKFRDHRFGQCDGEIEMLRLQRGLVKLDDAGQQERVAFEQLDAGRVRRRASGGRANWTFCPRALCLNERQVLLRRGAILFIAEHRVSPRHRAEHQAVPGREDFVVAMRADALGARASNILLLGGCEQTAGLPRRSGLDRRCSTHFGPAAAADGCGQRNCPAP